MISVLRKILFISVLGLCGSVSGFSQVTVNVSMDTSVMLIGDQTRVVLHATYPDSLQVKFPVYADTIIKKLEILDIPKADTVYQDHMVHVTQSYLVTSFDSGWYEIPPMKFAILFPKSQLHDTLESLPVYFGVQTIRIDTTQANAIADIKKPLDAPLTFKEVLPFVEGGLGLIILLFLAYYLFKRFAKKEPLFIKKEKPREPAHVIALRDLDGLKEEKLWQKGLVKEYYSRLTDIIRTYMDDRFDIHAMELTTEEIRELLRKNIEIDKPLKENLVENLVVADFVKFAKASTLADENEKILKFAYDFVLKTKPVIELRDDDKSEGKSKSEDVESVENNNLNG